MSVEEIMEWLWQHPPQQCDDVDAATRKDLCEQVAELAAFVAQQERNAQGGRVEVRVCR